MQQNLKTKISSVWTVFKSAAPYVGLVGLTAGLVVDILNPLMSLSPYLLGLSILASLILLLGPFGKKIRAEGFVIALQSKIGAFQIFALGNVLVWLVLVIFFSRAPRLGFLADQFDYIRVIQQNVLNVEAKLLKSEANLKKIDEELAKLGKDLSTKPLLISNPQAPQDFYQNARFYQLKGDIPNAISSYESLLGGGFSYVDVHENYIALKSNYVSRVAAKSFYETWAAKNTQDPVLAYMLASLADDHVARLTQLKQVVATYPNFAPAFAALASEYESIGIGQVSSLDAVAIRKMLDQFGDLDKRGDFAVYYLDKSKLDSKRDTINKLKQTYTVFKKTAVEAIDQGKSVSITVDPGASTNFTFVPADGYAVKIFYSIDDPAKFIDSGSFDFDNPLTKQKQPNTMVLNIPLKPGVHQVYAKYLDMHGNESAVAVQEFTVK